MDMLSNLFTPTSKSKAWFNDIPTHVTRTKGRLSLKINLRQSFTPLHSLPRLPSTNANQD